MVPSLTLSRQLTPTVPRCRLQIASSTAHSTGYRRGTTTSHITPRDLAPTPIAPTSPPSRVAPGRLPPLSRVSDRPAVPSARPGGRTRPGRCGTTRRVRAGRPVRLEHHPAPPRGRLKRQEARERHKRRREEKRHKHQSGDTYT